MGRFRTFHENMGLVNTGLFVFVLIVLTRQAVGSLSRGTWVIILPLLLVPALITFLCRGILVRHSSLATRILRIVWGVMIAFVVGITLGLALPRWSFLVFIPTTSAYIAAGFWLMSDPGLLTKRRLLTMLAKNPQRETIELSRD